MQISTGERKVEHLRGEPRICFDTTTADDGGDQQCQCQTHPLGGHRFHIWGFRACGLRAQGLLILNFQTSSNSLLPAFQTRSSRAPTENHIRSFRLRVLNDTKRPLLCTFRRPIIHTFHTKYLSVTKYTMGSIGVENTASHASRTVTTQTDSHHSPLNRIIRDACQPKNHSNPQ